MANINITGGGMMGQMMAQPAQLSESQRNLINQTGKSFGSMTGGYQQPNAATSQGALAAAMQAQKFGHMDDYKEYMDVAKRLQSEEAAGARNAASIESADKRSAAQIAAQERMATEAQIAKKYIADESNTTARDLAVAKIAAQHEMLGAEIKGKNELADKDNKAKMERLEKEMAGRWKMLSAEEKGKNARAMLATSMNTSKKMPTKGDIEALALMAKHHPDEKIRNALSGEDAGIAYFDDNGVPTAAAVRAWKPIRDGHSPDDVLTAIAAGYKYDDKEGKWLTPEGDK